MMGRKALIAVLCWIALNGTSAKAVQTSNSVGLIDNISAESAPPLYRNVPVGLYSYASATTPYAAYSFHVPQFVAPNFNQVVPLNQERILAQSTNNYLRDSYGQRAPQAYAYKAALPQQFVPLQKLPPHLSQPLVAAAPDAQYGQATHFFEAPFRLANLQALSQQNGNPFGAPQSLVYAQNVKTLASPAPQQVNGQPVAQQQSTSNNNIYANAHTTGPYSHFWTDPKAQTKQEEPKISASDHKENQQIVQSLPLVHAPKQTTITSFTNGKKTVVNLITKPPVPLLDLTLLEPLTFENPLVPQVQHFLPKIHSVTYKTLPELNQKNNQKVITIKRKTTKKTKKQKKPKIIKDEIEVNHTPKVSNDHNTELAYEINSPTYKETISEKKVSYNKETTSKPVVISYEKKTEMQPVTYSYGKTIQKEPVHYSYVHTSNDPKKQAYLDENKEKTKHLIYHFSPEEQNEEQSEEEDEHSYNAEPQLESVEIYEENPNESISEQVSPQQQNLQHHEHQHKQHQHQQHEHRPQQQQHQPEPHKSQQPHPRHHKNNEPQQQLHPQNEPRQYHQYEPHKHEHYQQQNENHHQQRQNYEPQHQKYQPKQHQTYEAQHQQQHQKYEPQQHQKYDPQQHQNYDLRQQKQHAPQQQIHDAAQHELAEEAYNEPNQNFREEPEPEDREVAYYQDSEENLDPEQSEEVYNQKPKNAHVELLEESPAPIVHKYSPQHKEKQYEAIVPEYEEDITILPAHKPHALLHAEENSNRGTNKKHNSHPEPQSEQVHYDYPKTFYSSPQEKSNQIVIKDDPPKHKEEVYKPNNELIEAMVKKQEESEEDFEQAYKNAAYGFPAYEAPVRNTDREKEFYNPANYGVPRFQNDFDEEKSPLRQYEPAGDDYPSQMRSNYKDTRDKTNEDYYTDYSQSRPQSLVEGKKKKEEYYDNYNEHKPQKYYAKDDSDKQQSAKYTVGPAYSYPGAPQQKFAKFTSRITPLDEYNYAKEAPIDSSAFGTGTYSSKMQLLEPHYQYGFKPIRVSRLLDRELAAMASDHSPETVKKMYKENYYIEKSSTTKS